jgi:molybdate transport repressor ModE-like protein
MKTSMRFDLVDLRLFLFVVEAASITNGAARAGMTLASASERIRLMEESLGAALLERHRRGVHATPAGAALVHHAQLVVQQLERMREELSEYADGFRGRVRLLPNTTATAEFLPAALGAFLSLHPQIDTIWRSVPAARLCAPSHRILPRSASSATRSIPLKNFKRFPLRKTGSC